LVNQYQDTVRRKPYDKISDAGFRCYSQFEEDGIILYVLTSIGMKSKKVVELCCGIGEESMSANLIINHGYEGFLFEGDKAKAAYARRFFGRKRDCFLIPPTITQAWITRENVNSLLREAGVSGEIDLLSLDMDGVDYYIWEAITEVNPRLCVFEVQNVIPGHLSLTIPYNPAFDSMKKGDYIPQFGSVSLAAMKKLSAKKGYRMIGSHRHGFNVFFLRNDIAPDLFPEVSIDEVLDNTWTRMAVEKRWPLVKDLPWVEV